MSGVVRSVARWHVGLAVAATALGAGTQWFGPGGTLLGAAAMGLALWAYGAVLAVVLRRGSPRLAMVLLSAKFLAFLGLGWLALGASRQGPDPLGFAVGVTCFPMATVIGALRTRGTDGAL